MAIVTANQEGVKYGSTVTMEMIHCYKCGIPFAVPADFKSHLHQSQDIFFCPSGHQQCYSKSTETVLKEKLETEREARAKEEQRLKAIAFEAQQQAAGWQTQWEKQLQEKKKVAAKLKRTEKRIANGVCTCCNRTFADLAAHMKTKHPEKLKA